MSIGRREFLFRAGAGALSLASGQESFERLINGSEKPPNFSVGIIASNFSGSRPGDGIYIAGLPDQRPLDAELTEIQIDSMVRTALDAAGELAGIIRPHDWVVIKPNIVFCPGVSEVMQVDWVPGMVADPRVVHSLIQYLVQHSRGKRITIAEASGGWKCIEHSKEKIDGWTTDWGGHFGGVSYKQMVANFSRRHGGVRFDIVDLNYDDTIEAAVPGGALAGGNLSGRYFVPQTILKCDRLISVAAMKINPVGVSLAIKNYFGIGPGSHYGFPKSKLHELGDPSEVMVDLFSFHPADYALVGGSFGVEGDDDTIVRHNVIVTGANAVAVDAVAAAVMGFVPSELLFLQHARKRGFGTYDLDAIRIRGNSIAEVRRKFVRDSRWHPA